MSNDLAVKEQGNIMERVLVVGDLAKLTPNERVNYYGQVCQSLGLNPLTKPFQYIKLQGKTTLYATRAAADQLRKLNGVSIKPPKIDYLDDLVVITVSATEQTGRTDTDLGVVTIGHLKGDAKANAIMKAITKAKRRVTLSICGLGWLDETEIETIPQAKPVTVADDGAIITTDELNEQFGLGQEMEPPQVKPAKNSAGPDTEPEAVEAADIDWREKVAKANGKTTLGLVASCIVNACPYYGHAKHALNAMKEYELLEGRDYDSSTTVTNEGALNLYDWLLERAEQKANEDDNG